MERIRKAQACRFLLKRQGLMGAGRFSGSKGIVEYVRQAGCVQYDPIDVCGRSHELALLSRVKGFSHEMLSDLLYRERALIDYFDKNMCIMLTDDWPCLEFIRERFRGYTRGSESVEPVIPQILEAVRERGSLSSQELALKERTDWYWSATTLGRAALETLYFRGELVIHHKTGSVKSYALAGDCLPRALLDAPDPFSGVLERQKWQVLRRIGAIGLLWNAPSDAWLGVQGLKARERGEVFAALEAEGRITAVEVEGIDRPLYLRAEELEALASALAPFSMEKRVRLLPPLDCLLWDRRLIAALFGFSYKWEIYTPKSQRRYGYYVLPVLYGERFAGRIEPVCDRQEGALRIRRFWPEDGFRVTDRFLRELENAVELLKRFHGLQGLIWEPSWLIS